MVSAIAASNESKINSKVFSVDDYLLNPPEHMEWVDGQLVEKQGMTAKHSRIQAKLAAYWINYKTSSGQGGDVYTEASCWTGERGRRPDVSYLTPELVEQFGDFTVLSQSFLLIAEVISPTDGAEEVFTKVKEYLQSGCQEVWLLFPESQWVLVITEQRQILFNRGDVVRSQRVLEGFSVAVDDLLA
ncbi:MULTISPECIES: Uma2 family endonuclease [unclassified Coleofasciculus]|uniref:Uma2 family endonuclease n=1 Tax=unclassified Coleofasciculus TaxID=2692782 RepID=UPI001882A06E|nr:MULTISPECIES: Uma2 family endonuclease [unclassified Coleofasciculus]MBE9125635.1 Uma2 family endonuclease [Coleofasciculus sp. LEGE 07081]MBE9148789.1 Uma2 family endonuclease [Coleofasciculus sp. LEGE 07092]